MGAALLAAGRLTTLSWVVPGPPVAKGRPRLGQGGRVYTPAKTRAYEQLCRHCAAVAVMVARGDWRPTALDRYSVRLDVYVERWTSPGDIDNFAKSVLDACNGCVWVDDRAVSELHVYRRVDTSRPRVEVTVRVEQNEKEN